MPHQTDNLEQIVRRVTQQVIERLQGESHLHTAGFGKSSFSSAPCVASFDNCNHCGHCAVIKKDDVEHLIRQGRSGSAPSPASPTKSIIDSLG